VPPREPQQGRTGNPSRGAETPAISIRDVADRAGVSTATVSRALSRPEMVSHATIARVRSAVLELGYSPDVFARGLATRKSRTLCFAAPEKLDDLATGMLEGVRSKAASLGWTLSLWPVTQRGADAARADGPPWGLAEGLICGWDDFGTGALTLAADAKLPSVHVRVGSDAGAPAGVVVDFAQAAAESAKWALGTRGAPGLFVLGAREGDPAHTSIAAYLLNQAPDRAVPVEPLRPAASAFDAAAAWAERAADDGSLDAAGVVCLCERAAMGLWSALACSSKRLKQPPRVVLLRGDADQSLRAPAGGVGTLQLPVHRAGEEAVTALCLRCDDPERPARTVRLAASFIPPGQA